MNYLMFLYNVIRCFDRINSRNTQSFIYPGTQFEKHLSSVYEFHTEITYCLGKFWDVSRFYICKKLQLNRPAGLLVGIGSQQSIGKLIQV